MSGPRLAILALLVGAALAQPAPPPPLGAQIALTVDHGLPQARLSVATFLPSAGPLPQDRQGIALDQCETLVPVSARDGMVMRDRPSEAECGGQPLPLAAEAPGLRSYYFVGIPEPGLRCSVTLEGVRFALPPLPEAPELEVGRLRLRWIPGGGDELRVVWPRSQSLNTVCRLRDDGNAPAPRDTVHRFGFVTRHLFGLGQAQAPGGPAYGVAVSTTAGRWLGR